MSLQKSFSLFAVILLGLLVGCSGEYSSKNSPEAAAEEWIKALHSADIDRLYDATCESMQGTMTILLTTLISTDQIPKGGEEVDTSSLLIEIVNQNDDAASVRVSGKFKDQSLEGEVWHMVREGRKWKYCGGD